MPTQIILLKGTARQVFREVELAARYRGEVTIGELPEEALKEIRQARGGDDGEEREWLD